MRWLQIFFTLVLLATAAGSASAQGLFKKAVPRPQTPERVQELLVIAQSDKDKQKRVDAVEELRSFDASTYPQIVIVLADLLKRDQEPNVRLEAANSLGKIRPTSQEAKQALDEAVSKDAAFRVRWQARSSLMFYSVASSGSLLQLPFKSSASKDKTPAPALAPGQSIVVEQPLDPTKPGINSGAPTGPPESVARPLPLGPAQTVPQQQIVPAQGGVPIVFPPPGTKTVPPLVPAYPTTRYFQPGQPSGQVPKGKPGMPSESPEPPLAIPAMTPLPLQDRIPGLVPPLDPATPLPMIPLVPPPTPISPGTTPVTPLVPPLLPVPSAAPRAPVAPPADGPVLAPPML